MVRHPRLVFSKTFVPIFCVAVTACSESTEPADAGFPDAGTVDTGPVDIGVDAGTPDMGEPDMGTPDAGPPFACEQPMRVDGVLDQAVSVMLDTTMTETRPRDLGGNCGNTASELRWAPQEVLEFHVPGTGLVGVTFDTAFPETDATFNTVVQIRETCERVPASNFPPRCFDDIGPMQYQSQGGFEAMGGDVVYIIVTGFSRPPAGQGTVDTGRVRIDFTVRANTAPTITSGSVILAQDDTIITVSGSDAEMGAAGVVMAFYIGDTQLDIYGDGVADENDVFSVPFEMLPTGTDFVDAQATVFGAQVNLTGYLRGVGATTVRARVYDQAWAVSDTLDIMIQEGQIIGLGEQCDILGVVCGAPLVCGASGTCEATPEVAAACGAAIGIPLTVSTTTATVTNQTGTTGAGAGVFVPEDGCVAQAQGVIGAETIYALEVPAGALVDLLVTTDVPGTGDTDTIIYLRSQCESVSTELACNDDRVQGDLQSDIQALSVGPGTYYLFVERYGGLNMGTAPHEVQVTVRPVRSSGQSCDDAGVLNRCAGGACSAGVCP